MSRQSITLKIIRKVNSRPKILHRKNKFLTPAQCRPLCNALIQPYSDFSSVARYPNLPLKLKNENLNWAKQIYPVLPAAARQNAS